MASFDAVPTCDYALLASDRATFFAQLDHALCDCGFAVLLNAPGLDAAFQSACFEAAHRFFAQPQEIKERVSLEKSPQMRGYAGIKKAAPGRVTIATEAYQLGPEKAAVQKGELCLRILRGPNLWPQSDEVPDLRPRIEELHRRYVALAREMGGLICEMLDTPASKYEQYFQRTDPDYVAAMNYNPAASVYTPAEIKAVKGALAEPRGAGAHVDGAPFVTLLIADQPGLEVVASDGNWVPVPLIPGSVVVNIGASLTKLSSGRCKATVHRVDPLRITAGPRVSLPFFLMPRLEGDLVPFEGKPRKRPPGWPRRDRGMAFAADRFALWPRAAVRWYGDEVKAAHDAVAAETKLREEAAARAKL